VGDYIFLGQSTAAVALGGLRIAGMMLHELGMLETISSALENTEEVYR